MNQIKENARKLSAAGLDTVFARSFSPSDIDRMVEDAQGAIESMKAINGLRDEVSEMIVAQAEQAKVVLFNV